MWGIWFNAISLRPLTLGKGVKIINTVVPFYKGNLMRSIKMSEAIKFDEEFVVPVKDKKYFIETFGNEAFVNNALKAGLTFNDLNEFSYCIDCLNEMIDSRKMIVAKKAMEAAMEWSKYDYCALLIKFHDALFKLRGKKKGPVLINIRLGVDEMCLEMTRNKRKRNGVLTFINLAKSSSLTRELSE